MDQEVKDQVDRVRAAMRNLSCVLYEAAAILADVHDRFRDIIYPPAPVRKPVLDHDRPTVPAPAESSSDIAREAVGSDPGHPLHDSEAAWIEAEGT
jgi:hypothetical protein